MFSSDLNDAVKLKQTEAVRELLSAGAHVNVTDSLGECCERLPLLELHPGFKHRTYIILSNKNFAYV